MVTVSWDKSWLIKILLDTAMDMPEVLLLAEEHSGKDQVDQVRALLDSCPGVLQEVIDVHNQRNGTHLKW